mmetsp:Transcript_4540/g.7727  ORF Transcript_4540/g.7727 Transcript_4540/m.7727 type:complete len:210 (-) Transcript_4540:383-1012(-)
MTKCLQLDCPASGSPSPKPCLTTPKTACLTLIPFHPRSPLSAKVHDGSPPTTNQRPTSDQPATSHLRRPTRNQSSSIECDLLGHCRDERLQGSVRVLNACGLNALGTRGVPSDQLGHLGCVLCGGALPVMAFSLQLAPGDVAELLLGALEEIRVYLVGLHDLGGKALFKQKVPVHGGGGNLGHLRVLKLEEGVVLGVACLLVARQANMC